MKKYLLAMLIATMFAFIGCTEAVTDTGDNDNTKTEETTTASYTVEHYQQNIENDEFTLVNDDTEEKSGKIGEDTKAIAKTYEGFTAKTVTQEKIADGGSTVVKIEYTRNVVTLTFDTDGGSEIESKSGKYGAELTVEAPTKDGYTFNSWNPALPTSFPAADTAYKAKWAIEGDYTITYELYEGTNAESNPVSYNVETATITLAEATKENYVFDGWYTDENFTDENKVTTIEKGSTGDITLYAKWIELITASNVAEKIAALTEKGTHTIKVTGTISSSTISEIKEALEDLYNGIYVNLDLSETTGLTSIDEKAFDDCDGLAGISIPDSVTAIGKNAFDDCDSLTSITIGDKVTSIGEKAFYDCDSLISITIGNGVTNVGYSIFDYCSSLTTLTINTADNCLYSKNIYNESIITLAYYDSNAKKITISDKVKYIDSDAFDYCNGIEEIVTGNGINSFDYLPIKDNTTLKSITIGNKITEISSTEFSGCTGLTSVTIGSGVTTLYGSAFSDCKNLESVIIDENNTSFKSSGNYILSKDGTKLVFWFGNLTELTIPDGITSISSSAFSGCTGLTSMTIPNSVTSIGNYAFENCTGLTSMTIPDSVTSIGAAAFQNCTNLTSVTIGSGLSSSYPSMFNGCTNLTTLTVSDSNTYLKSNGNCIYNKDETKFILCANGLTEVTILDTVTAIGGSAFYGCTNLTNVTIPSGVTKIDSYTFQGCTNLTSVTIPSGVTAIGYSAFEGCTSLANVTIPSGVTEIASSTFKDCTGLTSVTIPENVTEIDGFAFSGCTGLTSVTIPANVTKIAWYAFQGCTNLESITFADTTSTWYYTSSSDYTDGTAIDVTDAATNATNLTSTFSYYSKYWYKEASSIE